MRHVKTSAVSGSRDAATACNYWSFHIIDQIDRGVVRFQDICANLNIARNILTNRLNDLRDLGLVDRDRCAKDIRCINYRLTDRGRAFLPVIVALRGWDGWDGSRTHESLEEPQIKEAAAAARRQD